MRAWRRLTGMLVAAVVATAAAGVAPVTAVPARAADAPIGAHSMLQVIDPPSFMEAMFSEAAAMGATSIRLDVAPALIFTSPSQPPDYSGLDEIMSLATRYRLRVVADLLTIPPWLADCPAGTAYSETSRCATSDLPDYASIISQIVAHADPVIHDWEVWNEPDNGQFFHGTPAQYAWMLRTAHDAITTVDPADEVLLGGISNPAGAAWLQQALATPGADAVHAFDIANVHERGALDALAGDIETWRSVLAAAGFSGPLWVTEHGYPSDPAFQDDPGYTGGEAAQAAYLRASLPTLLDAGAAKVFVTERDNLGGRFAAEGVLGGDVRDPPPADPEVVEKPAFAVVGALNGCYADGGTDCLAAPPAATPAALTMPPAAPRARSEATVTVSDRDGEPLVLGHAAVAGAGSPQISLAQDGCAGRILEPDETCTVRVRFAPLSGGAAASELWLPSDQGMTTVPVSATAPSVSSLTSTQLVDPRFLAGPRGDGPGHAQRWTATIVNPLAAPVRVSDLRLSGERFALAGDSCLGTLASGASCRLSVVWRPMRAGTAKGTLTVTGDGAPLVVALRARAWPLPAIRRAASEGCLAALTVTVSQPARVAWSLHRGAHPVDRDCAPGRMHGTRTAASGAGRTNGSAATGSGRAPFRARLSLPGASTLRPGAYRLTITPSNLHGAGAARSIWLTVP